MAAKKTKRGGGAAFVRTLAHDVPAKEVVARAAARGIALKESTVYSVRSEQRKAASKRQPANQAASAKPKADTKRKPAPVGKRAKLKRNTSAHRFDASRLMAHAQERFLPRRALALPFPRELEVRERATPTPLQPEQLLRALIIRLGIDTAERVLAEVRHAALATGLPRKRAPLHRVLR